MSIDRTLGRVIRAAGVGLAGIAACAGAAPSQGGVPQPAALPDPQPIELARPGEGKQPDRGPSDAGPGPDDGKPRCPYGSLEDPHRGFVRCLTPDERDAGWLPPRSQGEPKPDPKEPAPEPARPAGPALAVEFGPPSFQNGDVARVDRALHGAADALARCVSENGGLSAPTGSLKVQFLVRARGKAEGVEITSTKGVSAEAAACVKKRFKDRNIGPPSADPVGVTVTLTVKPQTK